MLKTRSMHSMKGAREVCDRFSRGVEGSSASGMFVGSQAMVVETLSVFLNLYAFSKVWDLNGESGLLSLMCMLECVLVQTIRVLSVPDAVDTQIPRNDEPGSIL